MAFNPLKHAFDDDGKPTPALNGFLDNALKVQRPVVLRWVKRLRAEHPDETPEQIAKRLERMYVRANTATGGVAGGAVGELLLGDPAHFGDRRAQALEVLVEGRDDMVGHGVPPGVAPFAGAVAAKSTPPLGDDPGPGFPGAPQCMPPECAVFGLRAAREFRLTLSCG